MKTIIIATSNENKINEVKRILKDLKGFILKGLNECGKKIISPEENGSTFEENALLKALYYKNFFEEEIVLSEDSGLMVDALNGAPSIYSSRFKNLGNDLEKNMEVLKALKNVDEERRTAKFVSVVVLCEKKEKFKIFKGEVYGKISFALKGKNGFGYDPIFIPEGEERTFAEMEPFEKDNLSHRGRALNKVKEYLENYG